MTHETYLESARRTLKLEFEGLQALEQAMQDELGAHFVAAVDLIAGAKGRVIISGMGKSGHIGVKIAATLASTGTPAFFVHPSEASHGDLGMITPDDVIVAFSWSGNTAELTSLINYSGRYRVPLIAVTSLAESALATAAQVPLILPRVAEACPHGLAPTTSTTMQLALGDALAIALLERTGFTAADFKAYHPGGSLGASLKFVCDVMHRGDDVPLVAEDVTMSQALVTMSEKSFGCLGVLNQDGGLEGVITDGDLRRHMNDDFLSKPAREVMTKNPKTVGPNTLASAALELINSSNITALFVVEENEVVGIIHVHDLLRSGLGC